MKTAPFNSAVKYNAMIVVAPLALANGHAPEAFFGITYKESETDGNGVTIHTFIHNGREIAFDDDFVNQPINGNVTIVEAIVK